MIRLSIHRLTVLVDTSRRDAKESTLKYCSGIVSNWGQFGKIVHIELVEGYSCIYIHPYEVHRKTTT